MKSVHSFILLFGLLFCALALGSASIASANALHLESCMEGGECDTASIGTTFKASGKVTLQNGFLEDACTSEVKGEVVATLSKSAEEDIKGELTEASFTSCSEGTSLSQGLSWGLATDLAQFPEALVAGGVKFVLHIGGETGDCTFEEDATHMANVVWKNGKPTTLKVSGNLKKVSGAASCGAEANLSGSYELTSVSDSKLAGATNLQILEGPTMTEELLEVRLETCHEVESECALASAGTVLYFVAPFVLKLHFPFPFTNTCTSEFEAEVLSPAASLEEELELAILWIEFPACSPFQTAANEATLPWSMTTTVKEFEAGSKGLWSGALITLAGEICSLQESIGDRVHWRYISSKEETEEEEEEESGPQIELSGSLAPEFCSELGTFLKGSRYELWAVADPELPTANYFRITD